MFMMIATAAFDQHGKQAVENAKSAYKTALAQKANLLVLPGTCWSKLLLQEISCLGGDLLLCGSCGQMGRREESLLLQNGKILLTQPALYSKGERGSEIALYEYEGISMAMLAGEDALAPAAGRLAAVSGALLILCPVEEDPLYQGVWAQVQQNSLYAAIAPSKGEACVLSPLCKEHPDGIMAKGRPGTMAMARLSVVDGFRLRLVYDPLSYLNRAFAANMPAPSYQEEVPPPAMKVAAVQRRLDFTAGSKGLLAKMDAHCAKAAEQGCALIAFPEYNWLDALGSVPLLAGYNAKLCLRAQGQATTLEESDENAVAAFFASDHGKESSFWAQVILRLSARSLQRMATRETIRLAKKYQMVVHGGTFVEKKKKKYYNTAIVAFPDGTYLTQRKLCLTQEERFMRMSGGEELIAFEVQGTLCCAPICMDATYYEPFLAAGRMGCDLAILPIANAEPYFHAAARRGAWSRAMESCMYIVKPALTGCMMGSTYTGYAGIYGPSSQPIALSDDIQGDQLVCGALDFEALHKIRSRMPEPNLALEENLKKALMKNR